MIRRAHAFAAAALACALAAPAPAAAASLAPVSSHPAAPARVAAIATASRELAAAGNRGVVRTVIEGDAAVEIPLRFLGVLDDAVGPGHDLYLVELEGPVAERVGVAAGMSGSPVLVDGQIVGALSYRFGAMPRSAIGGVTPIESVLDAARGGGAGRPPRGPEPIATPVVIGGLAPAAREWLAAQLEPAGFVAVAGGTGGGSENVPPLEPGMAVGVRLIGGDVHVGASGTVTWVDGDTVYAFGHPFFASGRVEMPMTAVHVVHTLGDMLGSFKMDNGGAEIGVIREDRLTAVVGTRGGRARTIRMEAEVRGGSYDARRFRFDIALHPRLTPQLVGAAAAGAMLGNTGFDDAQTVLGSGTIRLRGVEPLPLEMAFSGEGSANPALAVASRLRAILDALYGNPFRAPQVESIELEFDVALDRRHYTVEDLLYDRGPVDPGAPLDVRCVLRGYRGEVVERPLRVRIPDDAVPGAELTLVVGEDGFVKAAVGQSLTRRLDSARDLESFVRALAEVHSPHRLIVALYGKGEGVVHDGAMYTGLPATAARLLSAGDEGRGRRTTSTPVARHQQDLPGPVVGGKVVRLRVRDGGGRPEGRR